MTQLNKQQLLDSFPDNDTGQILPLDMRNFVDSVELKYDNYTIVKPGQPLGNKFPDPNIDNEIILDDNTIWVMNGNIAVSSTIVFGQNVQILSLSGSFTLNSLTLDPGAGAIPLLKSREAPDPPGDLLCQGVVFSCASASGRLFDCDNFNAMTFDSCLLSSQGVLGNIVGNNSLILYDKVLWGGIAGGGDLLYSGTFSSINFDGNLNGGGFLGVGSTIADLTGATVSRVIANGNVIEFDNAGGGFVRVADDNTIENGVFASNIFAEGSLGYFIEGIDQNSLNTDFEANKGIPNTEVEAGLLMANNDVVTVNPGLGLWTPIVGNDDDAATPVFTRFERTNPLEITYRGKENYNGLISLGVSVRRASGSGSTQFSVSVAKNGIPITQDLELSIASITNVGTLASATLTTPGFFLIDGMTVTIAGANEPEYNGTFVITNVNVGAGTFDYTMGGDPGTPATGTLLGLFPVEVSLPVGIDAALKPLTIPIPAELVTDDVLVPIIRGDASGTIDSVVENLQFFVRE